MRCRFVITLPLSGTAAFRSRMYAVSGPPASSKYAGSPNSSVGRHTSASTPAIPPSSSRVVQNSGRIFSARASLSAQLVVATHRKNAPRAKASRGKAK